MATWFTCCTALSVRWSPRTASLPLTVSRMDWSHIQLAAVGVGGAGVGGGVLAAVAAVVIVVAVTAVVVVVAMMLVDTGRWRWRWHWVVGDDNDHSSSFPPGMRTLHMNCTMVAPHPRP